MPEEMFLNIKNPTTILKVNREAVPIKNKTISRMCWHPLVSAGGTLVLPSLTWLSESHGWQAESPSLFKLINFMNYICNLYMPIYILLKINKKSKWLVEYLHCISKGPLYNLIINVEFVQKETKSITSIKWN